MVNSQAADIVEFLRPHCGVSADEPSRYARMKIGATKPKARVWSFRPIRLESANPAIIAQDMLRRLQTERRSKDQLAWLEVLIEESSGSSIEDCYSRPIPVPATDSEVEEEETGGKAESLDRAVGHAINGLGQMAQIAQQGAIAERHELNARIAFLESKLMESYDKRLEMTIEVAQLRGELASGGDGSGGAMQLALEQVAPLLGPALAELWARWGKQGGAAPGATGAAAGSVAIDAPDPGSDFDGALMVMGGILAQNPGVLTAERWTRIKAAWGALEAQARANGL